MQMNGGEAVVEVLKREKVTQAFGIVGSSILEVFDLLPRAGISYIGVRHEQWAAHMADAFTRVSRTPSICIVQNGAGVTNLVTGFGTAMLAHSPIVGLGGAPLSSQLGIDTYQEIDHVAVMEPVTKWCARVNRPDRIPEFLRRAVREACTPPMGPTFLDIPRDYLYEVIDVEMRDLGHDRVSTRVCPDESVLEEVLRLIGQSKRPILLVGGGVVWGSAADAVCRLADTMSAPICTSYGHNDAVPNSFRLYLGSLGRGGSKAAMRALAEADLILAVGTRMDPFTFLPYYGFSYFPTDAPVVQVDVDGTHIGRTVPITLGLVCDARGFVDALLHRLRAEKSRPQWLDRCVEWKGQWLSELEGAVNNQASPAQLEAIYAALNAVMKQGTIVTADIGSTPSYVYSMLNFELPGTLITPLRLGGVGFSIPAALGSKLARPDMPVVALLGDGAFTMEISSLITAVEYGINIVAIVFDNSAWGAEKANQQHFYERRYVGTNLSNPDLLALAKALGADAYSVSSVRDFVDVFQGTGSAERPTVIHVSVDPERFPLPARRDALRVATRKIYV